MFKEPSFNEDKLSENSTNTPPNYKLSDIIDILNDRYAINDIKEVVFNKNYKISYINSYLSGEGNNCVLNFFLFEGVSNIDRNIDVYFPNTNNNPALPLLYKDLTYADCVDNIVNCNSARKNEKAIKIYFSGENIFGIPYYRKYQLVPFHKTMDLFISFEHYNFDNYIRFPLWISYFFNLTSTYEDVHKWVEKIENIRARKFDKLLKNNNGRFINNFACLLASHDLGGSREQIYKIVDLFGDIECCGIFRNNSNVLKEQFNNNKHEYIKNFQFNICPENFNNLGYTTEKIFEALSAGVTPIYWGSCGYPEPEILNQNRLLILDDRDKNELYNKLHCLLNDEEYAKEFLRQNVFVKDAAVVIYSMIKNLRTKIEKLGIKYQN